MAESLEDFIWSAAFSIEAPQAYGPFHILFTLFGCGLALAVSEVFKQFSQWFGWYINTPIYIFAVCLGAYLIFMLICWFRNKEQPVQGRKKSLFTK